MAQSVFRTLLGSDLDHVSGVLRQFSDEPGRASGRLTVTHHPGRSAQFFIWILKLPKAGRDQTTSIEINCNKSRETWSRQIGESRLKTTHRIVDGLLEERAGLFRFLYEVSVVNGGLHYHQVRVYFAGIRLPRTFSPIVNANACGDEDGWELDMTVSCPRCGPICQYQGRVTPT